MTKNNTAETLTGEERSVTTAVVKNQLLWTAGYSLTSGGFLIYFAKELGATGFLIAILLVVPETAGLLGLCSRWLVRRVGSRKRVWFVCSLIARVTSLGIPLLAFPKLWPETMDRLPMMALLLAIVSTFQAIAYLTYLSWVSELVSPQRWGRFFSIRTIATVSVLIVVPTVGGFLRDQWNEISAETALWAYVITFLMGTGLMLLSMWPLLKLHEKKLPQEMQFSTGIISQLQRFQQAFADRSMRWLLMHSWCLAIANGLTQAVFFSFLFVSLNIQLTMFYLLLGTMRIVKLPVSWFAGKICDRRGDKWVLFFGLLLAASAMLFWFWATPERWWLLFGAYAMWGFFAAVNLAGRNLALKLSPKTDNILHLGLFRVISGALAGFSGLAGAVWLTQLQKTNDSSPLFSNEFTPFQFLFLMSFIGRITAAFFVLPIHEPKITN